MGYTAFPKNVTAPFILEVASADTNAHAMSAQVVRAPVLIQVQPGITGTLKIDDGASGEITLDDEHPSTYVYVRNLNQIRYTFSVHGAGEIFSVSTAI